MVLLVVDTQKLITNEKLYNFHEFVSKVEKLIDTARKNRIGSFNLPQNSILLERGGY